MTPEPRSRAQRREDTLARLRDDVDVWVASASADGDAYLVPLSYYWDGSGLLMATPRNSPTGRNLLRAGRARVALGTTRDVVMIEGPVEEVTIVGDPQLGDAHASTTGFDPRALSGDWVYLRLVPAGIQAWREENELAGRRIMRAGEWL